MKASEALLNGQFTSRIVYEIINAETGAVVMRDGHENLQPTDFENQLALKYAFQKKIICDDSAETAASYGIVGPLALKQFQGP